MLKKLIGGVLADFAFALTVFAFAHLFMIWLGIPVPDWPMNLWAFMIVPFASLIPDYDLVPYMLIRKGKYGALAGVGIAGIISCLALGAWSGKISFFFLALAGALGISVAFFVREKVIERASHWPLWHKPIPVLVIVGWIAWLFAMDFAPGFEIYYTTIVVLSVVTHSLHDGIQTQGFPYLSPFTDTHYQWQIFTFCRVSSAVSNRHYAMQYKAAQTETSAADLAKRGSAITPSALFQLIIAVATAFFAVILW